MKPGSGLLLAAGALATATTTTSAFVLPPKVTQPRPTGPTQPKPLQVKTGNWFGEGVGGGSNPFGEMKLALRDALWKADEAIQRMAVPAFNESTGESLVAAFQAKLQQAAAPRKQQQPEPTVTKFAVASAAPVAAAKPKASAAVPPPVTRTPPPPRMPPTDDEEEKKKQQAQAQAAKPTMTVTEKPAVVIPPSPTAVPQVPPAQAPVSAAAKPTMTVAPPAAAAPATPAAAPTPVAVKSARELVAEKARSAPINTVAASTPYTAAVPEIREDPQVVRARSQRWAEDVVKRAKRQEAETVAKKAASSSSLSSVAASPAVAAAALEKARKRRQEEKAAEQARRAKAAAAREKLRAERAAALKAIEQRLVVGKEEPVLAVKPAMPAAQAAAAVESMAAKAKEATAAAASAAAAMVVDVKGQAQPTVGALMAAAQKEMDAAVTKAEAVVTAASKAVIFEKVEAEDEAQPDRSSVETMLRDSKAAAVEEWHRARTATTEAGDGIKGKPASALDEKAAQLEARLVEEIRAGPGEGIMGCVDLLEKVGETQLATPAQAAAETGRWDLAYSSGPVASLLALPRWLARFLVGLSATVDTSNNGKVAVVYRAVFKFLDWLPRLRRTQRAAVQPGASPRQQAEVLSGRPRFTLGKRLSFTLPRFLAKLGTAADVVEAGEAPRLTSSCTYLGSQLKICRVARPASGAGALRVGWRVWLGWG